MGTGSTNALSAAIDEHSPSHITRASGQNFSKGFELGILDGRSGVINAAAKVAQDAVNKAKSTLQIHSPSQVMREQVGRMLSMGMALGIDERNLSRFGRELLKVIKLEEKRAGPSMVKGVT